MRKDLEDFLLLDQDAASLLEPSDYLNSPEKRLLFAVCERAVRDLFSSSEEERLSSIRWFDDDGGNDPFSFPWICEVLDINRRKLLSRIWSIYDIGTGTPNASRELYMLIDLTNAEESKLSA